MSTNLLSTSPAETAEARADRLAREKDVLDAAVAEAKAGDAMDHVAFDAWCGELIAGIPE